MADAPKAGNKSSSKSAPAANTPVGRATNDPAPRNQPTKASDRKGAGGAQVQDQVKAEQAVRVDGIPASTGLGTLLEPWQARDELHKALSELDAVTGRVESLLGTHYDLTGLRRHLQGARKWFGAQLGLEVNEHGQLQRADGGSQLSSVLTQDGADQNPGGEVKTPEGKAAGAQTKKSSKSSSKSSSSKSSSQSGAKSTQAANTTAGGGGAK